MSDEQNSNVGELQNIGAKYRIGPDLQGKMAEQPEAPSETGAQAEQQRLGRTRYTFDPETGEGKFEVGGQHSYRAAPATIQGVTVRGEGGMPTSLAQATGKSVVTLGALGDTSVDAAMMMGYVQPRNGGGYELTPEGEKLVPQAKAEDKPKPEEKKPDAPAADLRGVKGTSEQTDAFLKTAEQGTSPAFVQGVLATMAKNDGEVPEQMVAEAANRLGMEPAAVREQIERAHEEYVQAGETAIRNVGVQSPEQFVADMKASNREAYHEAVSALASDRNLGPLQELARAWVKRADVTMVATLEKAGLETWQDPSQPGTVFIRTAGLRQYGYEGKAGSISVAEAVKAGLISFA